MAGSETGLRPDRPRFAYRRRLSAGCGTALAFLALSCTPPPPPAPQPVFVPPTVRPAEPLPSRNDAGKSKASPESRPAVVEIEPEAADAEPKSLVEAAEAEKRRRAQTGEREPMAVITNKNLKSLAKGVELTYVEEGNEPAPEVAAQGEREEQEAYWRDRLYEARLAWRRAVDDQEELETQAARLRQRFYSEDDPFVRDGQIKPEWDRVLDRIQQTKDDILRHRSEVDRLVQEGRLADAEPGWLDAGAELEPEPSDRGEVPPGELPAHEVMNPPTDDGSGL